MASNTAIFLINVLTRYSINEYLQVLVSQLPYLSFTDSESMLVSQKEWNQIIGSDKGAPSWLQVELQLKCYK